MKAAKLLALLEVDAPNLNNLPPTLSNLLDAFNYSLRAVQNGVYSLDNKENKFIAYFDLPHEETTLGDGYKEELNLYKTDPDSQQKVNQIVNMCSDFFKVQNANFDAAIHPAT